MSYFKANLGGRPLQPMNESKPEPESRLVERKPYFSAELSPKLVGKPDYEVVETHCPLCRGSLAAGDDRLLHCRGRCETRWLRDSSGHLLDPATLPFGICACCSPPTPLSRSDRGAVCPAGGVEYLILPDGPVPLDEAAPLGLCLCCQPPAPLIEQDDGTLVCRAKPFHQYRRDGDHLHLIAPTAQSTTALDAIDIALKQNNAGVTVNGLFDLA